MLISIIEYEHLAFLPGLHRIPNSQIQRRDVSFLGFTLQLGDEEREVEAQLDVARAVMRSYLSAGGHCAEESVAEWSPSHQLVANRFIK